MSEPKPPTNSQGNLLAQWKRRKAPTPRAIPRRPDGAPVPPTRGQQRLWVLQELYPDRRLYQYAHRYRFDGPLDADALERSLQILVERHEVLRSNYVREEGRDSVVIHPPGRFRLQRTSVAEQLPGDRESTALRVETDLLREVIALATGPLFRATLIDLGDDRHWLVIRIHHIIGDRGSLTLLNRELYEVYGALVRGERALLPELPVQFADYAHWKHTAAIPDAGLSYWTEHLRAAPPLSAFPSDRARPRVPTYGGALRTLRLAPETSLSVRQLARELRTTPNVLLLAAFQVLLMRYGNPEEVVVGTPVSIRDRTELESVFGFLNETVALRSRFPDAEESFAAFVTRVKRQMESALQHRDVPFEAVIDAVGPDRVAGANPLFQNMFVYNAAAPRPDDDRPPLPDGLTVEDTMLDLGVAKFDTTLFVTDLGDGFELQLEYATDLFEATTADRLLAAQQVLLRDAIAHPQRSVSRLRVLTDDELEHRKNWNDTATDLPRPASVVDLIIAAAGKNPDAVAVSDTSGSISYGTLLARADRLAAELVNAGVRPGAFVGLRVEREIGLAVGILGILRAGAAYVPLDPAYPVERTRLIVEDAGIDLVVTGKGLAGNDATPVRTVTIPEESAGSGFEPPAADPERPAYLIYTSGSTGRPKGVVVTHANLVHSTTARFAYFSRQPGAFLLLSSFAFDSSVAGIFWTLSQGGHLVIPPARSEQDMAGLALLIERHRITHTLLLPSLYQLLLEQADDRQLGSLQTVMVAGEACSSATVRAHFGRVPRVELVNEYGPTEGTVWCTAHTVRPEDASGTIPIGRPIPNTRNYLMSGALQPVPVGVPGELYVAGPGVTAGYWRRPELTREKFILHPDGGERLYRTGDLAAYRPDGKIDFLGRADRQVKVRGYRVEPEEVSRVLEELPAVREAVTIVDTSDSAARLVAYYTGADGRASDIALRAALHDRLPEYLVPAVLVPLDRMPRLPNGKVDVTGLPAASAVAPAKSTEYAAPVTPTEKVLAEIWAAVLGVERVGRDDHFFDLGGDSLRSIRVIARARRAGVELRPTDLFRFSRLRELAAEVDRVDGPEADDATADGTLVALQEGGAGLPLFCIHSGGGHVFFYQPLSAALEGKRPVYAIQPATLATGEALPKSIEEMAADYLREIRAIQPHGPYHLLGTCFSNVVVLEIAHRLLELGEPVGRLIFVDSGPTTLERQPEVKPPAITSAWRILSTADWKKLRRAIYRRWFYVRQALGATVENEEEKKVRLTTNALYQLYFRYDWRAIDAPVTLIRSTEFAGRADKAFHLTQWSKLAPRGLDVRVTDGTHLNLFASPQAEGLAKEVEACLPSAVTTP